MNFSCFTKKAAVILVMLFCVTRGHYCCVHSHPGGETPVWYQCLLPHTHGQSDAPPHEHSCTGGQQVVAAPEDVSWEKHSGEVSPLDLTGLSARLTCEKDRTVGFCTRADREYGRSLRLYLLFEILII